MSDGGSVAPPMALAGLAGVVVTAALVLIWGDSGGAAARLLDNAFCRGILALGVAALVYAMLELRGLSLELRGRPPRSSWITGRSARAISMPQWQALRARRRAPLTYAVFALPVLGFLGTVIGISGAIGDLGELFQSDDRSTALAEVLGQLRFAFDTTFLGLVGVLPAALGMTVVDALADRVEAELQAASQ